MKNVFVLFILVITCATLSAQTMKWISVPAGTINGKCKCETNTKINKVCYALEYVPNATGTLTSYTAGFMVSCTSIGSPVKKNESCTMTNSVQVVDVCAQMGAVLLNSSGNTGGTTKVTAGEPIILHQVCFYIPQNEKLTIREEEVTDLTTSITGANNQVFTEFPSYESQTFGMPRPDASKPTAIIDFKVLNAGEQIAQLDWTVDNMQAIEGFDIMRSTDGVNFEAIGAVDAAPSSSKFSSFQFFDKKAVLGKNYYKISLRGSEIDESVIRWVTFESIPFAVAISPNPATNFILVDVSGATSDYELLVLDISGKLILQEKADVRSVRTRLSVEALHAGVYTVQVKAGDNTYTEKISVIR